MGLKLRSTAMPVGLAVDADPYLAWSSDTGWSGHASASASADAQVPLLLELSGSGQWNSLVRAGLIRNPACYGEKSRFVAASARRDDIAAVGRLVRRLEFALPRAAVVTEGVAPGAKVKPVATAPLTFAVIDRGCAFLHSSFRRPDAPQRTRLLSLWDQGSERLSAEWRSPADFGYGRELSQATIDALIARTVRASGATESSLYREHEYLLDGHGRVHAAAHGTHVLDVGAGRATPGAPRSSAKPPLDDAIARAPLIFVDVPQLAPGDTTGASSGAYLLDALHYIRARAGDGVPVVVSLSLGALAGPHDGSSLTEAAIDDFLRRDKLMVLTVAAGNAALEAWHACGLLDAEKARDAGAELRWRLRPDDPTDSFVELWFKAAQGAKGPGPVRPQIRLSAPDGRCTAWVDLGTARSTELRSQAGALCATVFARPAGRIGTDAMALVAVAPCAGKRRAAPHGLWRIELRADAAGPVRFDAWVQRDEPVWEGGTPVQSSFESVAGAASLSAEGTLSNLASGSATVVVGAADAAGRPARYSSRGVAMSARRRGVRDIDALAPTDDNAGLGGLLAAGVLSGTLNRMGGTSAAAPSAAREIARRLLDGRIKPGAAGWDSLASVVRAWLGQQPRPGRIPPILDGRSLP